MSPTVPIGGTVMVHYDYDVGENYAVISLRFYCKVAKGSLPRYQWFLNNTLLHDRGSFYYVHHQPPEQSILLLSVGRSSAGTYHCEVSDSFDNSTTMRSKTWYLDKEGIVKMLHLSKNILVRAGFISLPSPCSSSAESSALPGGGGSLWMFCNPGSSGLHLLLDWSAVKWGFFFFQSFYYSFFQLHFIIF